MTAYAMLGVLNLQRLEYGSVVKHSLILSFKLLAVAVVALAFALSFGFVIALDRGGYALIITYAFSLILSLAVAAALWQRATPEVLARLKRIHAEFHK